MRVIPGETPFQRALRIEKEMKIALRALRKEKCRQFFEKIGSVKVDQRTLADLLGSNQTSVYHYKIGLAVPKQPLIEKMDKLTVLDVEHYRDEQVKKRFRKGHLTRIRSTALAIYRLEKITSTELDLAQKYLRDFLRKLKIGEDNRPTPEDLYQLMLGFDGYSTPKKEL
jgi:hypothetical protein